VIDPADACWHIVYAVMAAVHGLAVAARATFPPEGWVLERWVSIGETTLVKVVAGPRHELSANIPACLSKGR
jgi:hypothetical protein